MKTTDLDAAQAHFAQPDAVWVKTLGIPSVKRLVRWREIGKTPMWVGKSVELMYRVEELQEALEDATWPVGLPADKNGHAPQG